MAAAYFLYEFSYPGVITLGGKTAGLSGGVEFPGVSKAVGGSFGVTSLVGVQVFGRQVFGFGAVRVWSENLSVVRHDGWSVD